MAEIIRTNWRGLKTQRRAGVLVPLFSVHSRQSAGVGDFHDLKLLVDWCATTGHTILQLLPMNDTGGFCPYDAQSSFALEPVYAALDDDDLRAAFPCASDRVDYRVKEEKLRVMRRLFMDRPPAEEIELAAFRQKHGYWLDDFALYKTIKRERGNAAWYEWESALRDRDPAAVEAFSAAHREEVLFEVWVQWLLHGQFSRAACHARQKDVHLMGDLPILVARDSADVWAHPDYFKLEYAAGAPPDMYCAKGQRWGMPTYHWEAIAADGYRYVREKLRHAESFYDLLRIDHVVGVFRIWSIPREDDITNQGLNGRFDPPDESVWEEHGREILEAMASSTSLLLSAEDLGTVPEACPRVMAEMDIPGTEVQRWVKDWGGTHGFIPPECYREMAVAALSTHDTTNWDSWWRYEAGTIDEGLFVRKCREYGIVFEQVRERLFDRQRSAHGRLRWREEVSSPDILAERLERDLVNVPDLKGLYLDTYGEKEDLWKVLGLSGCMREVADRPVMRAALGLALASRSVFCVQNILDWLVLADLLPGDSYAYRFNTPGTTGEQNWSRRLPVDLEDLMGHDISRVIRDMINSSGRGGGK